MESRVELKQSGYHQVCKHLEEGKDWRGMDAPDESEVSGAHPLMVLSYELCRLTIFKRDLLCFKTTEAQKQAIIEINTCLNDLRKYIKEGIETLSVEELLALNIHTHRYEKSPLLEFLGEIGETDLFKLAHSKLSAHLNVNHYLNIYLILRQAYEGSRLSEQLGLGLSLLLRGNALYPRLMGYLFAQFDQNKKQEFLELFIDRLGPILDVKDVRQEVARDEETFIRDSVPYITDQTIDSELVFDLQRKKGELRRLYQEYVTSNHSCHLMDKLESHHFSMKSASTNSHRTFINYAQKDTAEIKPESDDSNRGCAIM